MPNIVSFFVTHVSEHFNAGQEAKSSSRNAPKTNAWIFFGWQFPCRLSKVLDYCIGLKGFWESIKSRFSAECVVDIKIAFSVRYSNGQGCLLYTSDAADD